MINNYDIVLKLTSDLLTEYDKSRIANDFAEQLGWKPSDKFDDPKLSDIANVHLVVEHGLENTAVISFLRDPFGYSKLNFFQKNSLLEISYNNLVDWHIYIESNFVTYVYNRVDPAKVIDTFRISQDNLDNIRSETFERITGKRPNPNIPALDDALIKTISFWKRNLSAELDNKVSNRELSTLFNSIIFIRATEDYRNRINQSWKKESENPETKSLIQLLEILPTEKNSLKQLIIQGVKSSIGRPLPEYLIDLNNLDIFDNLDKSTIYTFLSDFYRNKFAPYRYDFSLMSKHALSRIYEHYVSILRSDFYAPQLALFPSLPKEEKEKAFGSVYTPQYIARFFSRYLREQIPPFAFKKLKVIDPACGSGIFLRTLLELQCDPTQNNITTKAIQNTFNNIYGIDIDENACQAARLSLALLYLVLINNLPDNLRVIEAEAIQYVSKHKNLRDSYDAVIVNPPYVALDSQSPDMRVLLSKYLENHAKGRIDMYLAFLKLGIDLLRPGGFGMYVIPHSFLLSENATGIRKLIKDKCWVKFLADLSIIKVFKDTSTYVILLVFQKKTEKLAVPPTATIVKCQDFIGKALQDAVEGKLIQNNFYSIYEVAQEVFQNDVWMILPPTEATLKAKFESFSKLKEFFNVREGFTSGNNDIFIIPKYKVPQNEASIFVPFLHDRKMQLFKVPEDSDLYFFYPYINGRKIDEQELKTKFPKTWEYLYSKKEQLEVRNTVRNGEIPWWQPTRPRLPENMMRPKIISPHLVLIPKFALDIKGKFAVSHSPILYPKIEEAEIDLLKYFVAILNSSACYWYISTHSHVYGHGYVMLEPKTLKETPVPDPTKVPLPMMKNLIRLVDERLTKPDTNIVDIDKKIDLVVSDLYNLTVKEREILGVENIES